MTIREINDPTTLNPMAQHAWELADDDGESKGHIAVSVISGLWWVHDLAHWGEDPTGAVRLCFRARRFIRDQGGDCWYANYDLVNDVTAMVKPLMAHGAKPVQLILRGDIR